MSERPIRPEILAAKIEKIENFELPHLFDEFGAEPRLFRALWFLQWVSQPRNYAGGLSKFASDLIRANTERIGTAHSVSVRATGVYKLSDAVQILREMPAVARERIFGGHAVILEQAFLGEAADGRVARLEDFLPGDMTSSREKLIARDRGKNRKQWEGLLLKALTPEALLRECTEQANDQLAAHLKALCELPHVGFRTDHAPRYFQDLGTALLEFIEKRAAELHATIAETEITQLVTRWILKSRNTRRAVTIIGNSRFGKTEAVELNAQMYPCSCRLVNTPATNGLGDLLREVAKSLGFEVNANNSSRELRERIDYVLRFSHLQLIFDELQFLLPAAYSRNTAPARLNWVRRSIMDQNIAALFVGTPQSYLPAKQRFVKTTGYAMEQFDERILKTVQLPTELSEQDLVAVARIHFGDLPEDYLSYVVGKVLAAERNFVSDIEKVATLAKDNATERGRKRPILTDIKDALADVLPTACPVVAEELEKEQPRRPVQEPCRAIAKRLPAARIDFKNSPNRGRGIRALKVPG